MAKTVLLTRAEGQNDKLAALLRASSIEPVTIPLLSIRRRPHNEAFKRVAMNLDRYDHIVFVSQNAVDSAMDGFEQYWPQWPVGVRWHAVGEATAALLRARDIAPLVPEQHSTEGLLASGVFDHVAGDRILIVRGTGGREALARELRARGAEVSYLEVYSRAPVVLQAGKRQALLGLLPAVAVVYSAETLEALVANLGAVREGLSIVVPSGRVGSVATGLGFDRVTVAGGTDEPAMLAAILASLD